jgi:hypothetical protein
MTTPWPFEPDVRELVEMLVLADYLGVERRSGGVRLSAESLARAVSEYGRRLVLPPSEAAAPLDVVPHRAGGGWSVIVPLWTAEEGRSDLSLELTILVRGSSSYRIEVDDLHVL